MLTLKKILKRLEGLHYTQEYLCLAKELLPFPLHAYLTEHGKVISDVTSHHAFAGYCPLIFALTSDYSAKRSQKITIVLSKNPLAQDASIHMPALAQLKFTLLRSISTEDGNVSFYKGISGNHQFTSSFSQAAGQLYNRLYNIRPGNVFLRGNLYKQVQIAYSLPRKISLITVGEKELFNLFPTDLQGQVSSNYYIISLRRGGMACAQVEAAKKILLSDMNVTAFKTVYKLGKNHMKPLREAEDFPFTTSVSAVLRLPIPVESVNYKELQIEASFDAGIHRLFLFSIISSGKHDCSSQTLAHIHNTYATWRFKQHLPNEFYLR